MIGLWKRKWIRRLTFGTILLSVAALAGWQLLRSSWLEHRIRARMVQEIERASGGRVSIGRFAFDPARLVFEVGEFRLRGTEPAAGRPLFETPRIRLGLKVVSFWKRDIDLAALEIDRPQVHLLIRPDGSTNLPQPRVPRRPDTDTVAALLRLQIGRLALRDGVVLFDDRKIPLRAEAHGLKVALDYDWGGPRYVGTVETRPLHVDLPGFRTFHLDTRLRVKLERNRLLLEEIAFAQAGLAGTADLRLEGFRDARVQVNYQARVNLREAAGWLGWSWLRGGDASIQGTAEFGEASGPRLAAGVQVTRGEIAAGMARVAGAAVQARVRWTPRVLAVSDLELRAAGAGFSGTASLEDNRRYRVQGNLAGLGLANALGVLPGLPPDFANLARRWDTRVSGPVQLAGLVTGGLPRVEANLTMTPGDAAAPLGGTADLVFDGTLELRAAHLETGTTRLDARGRLGDTLQLEARARTAHLADLTPLADLSAYPIRFPNGGAATFAGTVSGPLRDPEVAGQVTGSNVWYGERLVGNLRGRIALSRSRLQIHRLLWDYSGAHVEADGELGLADWTASAASPAAGSFVLKDVDAAKLLALAGGRDAPLSGLITAAGKVGGTVGAPRLDGRLQVRAGEWQGERFERIEAEMASVENRLEVRRAIIALPAGQAMAEGAYDYAKEDIRRGTFRFEIRTASLAFEKIASLARQLPNTKASLRSHLFGAVEIAPGEVRLRNLRGHVAAAGLEYQDKPVGTAIAAVASYRGRLNLRLDAKLLGTRVTGRGSFGFEEGYPGDLSLRVGVPSIGALRAWFQGEPRPGGLDYDGTAEAILEGEGPLARPAQWKGRLAIPAVRIFPLYQVPNGPPPERLVVRNEGPMEVSFDGGVARVERARLVGVATNLEASGSVQLAGRQSLNLHVAGGLDLRLIDEFSADLTAEGQVSINADVRGTPARPSFTGRLELKDAALGLEESPAGLSRVQALILFSEHEAKIQSLSAEAGGGRINGTGFVEFLENDYAFRLETKAQQVRIRYPEGVSTTSDATFTWSGTLKNSLLTGRVTIQRASFNPRTDLSSILAKSAEPVRTPSSRTGVAAGIQFDVLVDSGPNLTVESALTQDMQAEASLRLRGTAFNPVLLGRISITQGEVAFFGNKYAINQGTVEFLNPLKLEPILNLDLETRVRGIDVILTLTGPINKLNITHRADPPLQFSEVIALLATGRAPASNLTLASRQAQQSQSLTQLGASALVGQAIATPVSNRLQRFFGVSRLKIDPNLTGVDNRPQARVTIEQQITKNITFTYITDVQRTNQQIVRMEWNVNRNYSVLVVREDNGVLGMDILYRKGFR